MKHLETAPKEILGNFPRLSREGALFMINNTEKNSAQGSQCQDAQTNHINKIPSLFEVKIPNLTVNSEQSKFLQKIFILLSKSQINQNEQ